MPRPSRIEQEQIDPLAAEIAEHLLASRAAVESYHEFAAFFAPFDPMTHKLIEEIAAGEQDSASELARLGALSDK